jgi:hypothetical protein
LIACFVVCRCANVEKLYKASSRLDEGAAVPDKKASLLRRVGGREDGDADEEICVQRRKLPLTVMQEEDSEDEPLIKRQPKRSRAVAEEHGGREGLQTRRRGKWVAAQTKRTEAIPSSYDLGGTLIEGGSREEGQEDQAEAPPQDDPKKAEVGGVKSDAALKESQASVSSSRWHVHRREQSGIGQRSTRRR